MRLLLLLSSLLFLNSCDPAQTIEIENKSEFNSTIKFYFDGRESHKFEGFLTNDSLIIGLLPNEIIVFGFGIGTWEIHNSLDSLVDHIDRIEVQSKKSNQTFSSEYQVRSFFEDRLIDDRFKARIIIEIPSNQFKKRHYYLQGRLRQ